MPEERRLNALREGEEARVVRVEAAATLRRRLMDLGLVPGTRVSCVARSPAGDPAAYLIRGAVIALRGADAGGVCLACGEACPTAGAAQAWD